MSKTRYIVTGKKPFYGPDCRFYQPGEIVELVDFEQVVDADGNVKSVGMKPGKALKPVGAKLGSAASTKAPRGRVAERRTGTQR